MHFHTEATHAHSTAEAEEVYGAAAGLKLYTEYLERIVIGNRAA